MFAIALVPVLLGILVGWGGFLGFREKLPRDRGAGVRTPATLASDEAFRLANKVAGVPTLVSGVIGVLSGIAGLLMPTTAGLVVATVVGLVGMFVLLGAGGLLGHRAALAVPVPAPAPAGGCGGCACGGGGCGSGLERSASPETAEA